MWLDMCEEAATPGGLNEQSLKFLRASEHYQLAESVSGRLSAPSCYACSSDRGYVAVSVADSLAAEWRRDQVIAVGQCVTALLPVVGVRVLQGGAFVLGIGVALQRVQSLLFSFAC